MLQNDRPAPRLPRLFEGEQILVVLGILGVVLSAVCGLIMLVQGRYYGPEGDLFKPLEFNLAVGLFFINVAAFLPLAGFSPRGRAAWRWVNVVLIVCGYTGETMQALRGFDPRFSHHLHSVVDTVPNIVVSLVGLGWLVFAAVLTWRCFRNPEQNYARLRLGLRYGLISTLVAVAAGVWMVLIHGRHVGAAGNVLVMHALGFEGLKTMLLTGYLAERSEFKESEASRWVHVAGIAWLAACAGVWTQTALGESVLTPSLVMAVTVGALVTWGYATLRLWPLQGKVPVRCPEQPVSH
jgi:hypothetical protein